jgi:NLR family CARD domain-containing protein 3
LRSLSRNRLGAEGAAALAPALAANSALTRVDIRHNNIAGDGAAQLAAAVLGNLKIEMFNEIPIKEMRANSLKELDLHGKDVGVEGGMVIAGLIPVMGALTALNLSSNGLEDEGVSAVCEAIQRNKETKLASLNFKHNRIGPVGANAVAAMVAVTCALTRVDVRQNNIAGDGPVQLATAVLGNLKIEMFNEIPIKEMRANSLTEMDLKGKGVGVEGGMVVAGLIPVMGGLTVANLLRNQLDAESAKMLAEVAKQKGISLCGIRRDQTTADFSREDLKPPDAILLASDLSQAVVTGSVTQVCSLSASEELPFLLL